MLLSLSRIPVPRQGWRTARSIHANNPQQRRNKSMATDRRGEAAPGVSAPTGSESKQHHDSTVSTRSSKPSNLVMQIILPRSLVTVHKWPVGPLMAQAAHVATAVIHENVDSPEVKEYFANLQGMRKTVMEVPDENSLRELTAKLDELKPRIPYHLWIEQPENIPAALALAPNKRPKALKSILDAAGCKLWQ